MARFCYILSPMRWKISTLLGLVLILILSAWLAAQAAPPQQSPSPATQMPYDWLFLGGRVMDGSGNPWFSADVAVRGGRIAAIGDLKQARARRTVSAEGKLIVPGFIDIHSHADDSVRRVSGLRSSEAARRAAPNLVSQGITTVVVNQDGRSPWPIAEQKAALIELGFGPNAILLAGHGTIRRQVMKDDFRRPASQAEIEQMRLLMRQAIQEGALGLSAGLEYVPGRWSTTSEVVALAEEIVPVQGVYISHQRSEGSDPMWFWPSQDSDPPTLLDAVRETIEIGARTGATVVASHIKAKGAYYWGSGQAAILLIERARAEGVNVWADQYPYDTTGSDGSTVLIPRWAWSRRDAAATGNPEESRPGFAGALEEILQDPHKAAQLRLDIAHEIARRGGAEKIVVFDYPESAVVGKSLAELAQAREIEPVEMAIRLQLEGFSDRPGGARLRGFSLSEEDIRLYIAQPWTATCSDAGIALPEDGPVHARFYGTFPRKIRRYALDQKVISLEQAIRSSTSLPAQILRLKDRGLLREGYAADLVVLDLDDIRDSATFFKPHQYAEGIDYVLVNGQAVVEKSRLTGALPGQVLSR